MITREEALERADRWINGGVADVERLEVGIHEFPAGYVVWGIEPPQEDPARPPAIVGSARGVVDKESGEISTWPPLPVDEIALRYAPPTDRFPLDVAEYLVGAGWRPGRDVPDVVLLPWYQAVAVARQANGQLYVPHDAALAALREFGGLHVMPGLRTALGFAPAGHRLDAELFEGLDETLGEPIYPIGVFYDDGPSELVMDAGGRVFLAQFVRGPLFVAETFDAAVIRLVRAVDNPLEPVLDDGTIYLPPGAEPEPTAASGPDPAPAGDAQPTAASDPDRPRSDPAPPSEPDKPRRRGRHHAPEPESASDEPPAQPDPPSDAPPPKRGRRRKKDDDES